MSAMNLRFAAPGPVARAFYLDRSPIAGIMGPIGSAKTTTCLMKIVATAMRVPKSRIDGVRYCKALVLRDTYRRMRRTVLESWKKRVPLTIGKFMEGGDNAPSIHRIQFVHPQDRSIIDLEIVFAAVGENADLEEFAKGFELTCGYACELDGLPDDVPFWIFSRTGRYPDASHVDPAELASLRQFWADFNAPQLESWVYRDFFDQAAEAGYVLYRQPGGLSPGAENLHNLPPDYYTSLIGRSKPWFVDRMVHNKPGISRAGKPVFPEFNDTVHVPDRPIEPVRGIKLIIGADAGGTPAAVIRQHMPDGQHRVLAELVSDPAENTGPTRFAARLNELLASKFAPWADAKHASIEGWCDPAAVHGDSQTGEGAWSQIVSKETGIRFRPARTNDPVKRQEAVRAPMERFIDGTRPGLLVSPDCPTLRRAYNSGYGFRKKNGSSGEYHEEVEKNKYSHVADADQYAALAAGGSLAAERTLRGRHAAAAPVTAPTDFNPLD